ncbi:NB-ARC domain-containing protein, partial [Streptomyces misionensis]|uniref:NB-ARC domain-containing protein n=1 Tax=Streptomyces misionensis TaxID=67331 RepID=UPI00368544E5
ILVLLDNARDAAQIRPLLPGTAGCAALVTSRVRMVDLAGAHLVDLDVMSPEEALQLFTRIVGEERINSEREAALDVVAACGFLPLAIRIAASRLAARRTWTVSVLAAKLADERRRLDELQAGDLAVKATFELGYGQLEPAQARAFRLLGLADGPDISLAAAAALLNLDVHVAEDLLEALVDTSLVESAAPGRYRYHDLVRLYARGMDPTSGPEALIGVLDHYIATALAAADTAEPGGEPCFVLPDDYHRPAAVRDFTDRATAMRWLVTERDDLALAAVAARNAGFHDRAWRIILLQWPQVVWRVRDNWSPLLELALDSARARADTYAESRVLNLLGWVLTEEGRTAEAIALLERSPGLARQSGDRLGEATALINLAVVQAEQGEVDIALENCEQAVGLARAEQDPHTEMLALQHLARMQLTANLPLDALESARTALDLGPEHEEVARRVLLLTTSGEAHLALGSEEEGIRLLDRAAGEAERTGYDGGAVRALEALLRVTA